MNPVELAPTQRPLLGSSEKIMCIQNKVGLYQGLERDEEHDCGTVYLTTQRLVYVDQQLPHERSLALNLQAIHRCTLHGGFLYTSAKICLYLKPKPTNGSDRDAQPAEGSGTSGYSRQNGAQGTTLLETTGTANMYGQARPGSSAGPIGWKCNICDQINRGSIKCTLCGVPHQGNYEFTDTCNVAADTRPVNASGAKRQPLRCPVCTFDNHESMVRCEMCDTGLSNPDEAAADQTNADPSKSTEYQRLRTQEQANSGRDSNGTISLIKLSFRAGGASAFYATLKGAVDNSPCKLIGIDSFGEHTVPPAPLQGQQKPAAAAGTSAAAVNSPLLARERRPTTGGISTIVNTAHETQQARDMTLRSAFSDLDALTAKANEIVSMAEHIATQLNSPAASKLHRKDAAESDEDNAERVDAFRQYLLDLGIDSPVTRNTAGAVFHDELARELCDYLENYVSQCGGTVALVDAYCLYNRAREFSLVYPSDFVQACEKFEALQLPLRLREYPSGLLVLEDASSASDALIISRVGAYIASFGPLTASDLAAIEDCALTLAEERLWLCERAGALCRDESVEGVRFYANAFAAAAAVGAGRGEGDVQEPLWQYI